MKQFGVVVVFRPGTTKDEIEHRLWLMRDIIDPHLTTIDDTDVVHEFNPEHGTPCWYIP